MRYIYLQICHHGRCFGRKSDRICQFEENSFSKDFGTGTFKLNLVLFTLCSLRHHEKMHEDMSKFLLHSNTYYFDKIHASDKTTNILSCKRKLWCDMGKPVTCRIGYRVKLQNKRNIIPLFFFVFGSLWTSVSFDNSIIESPTRMFWKEDNSNFHMIAIT